MAYSKKINSTQINKNLNIVYRKNKSFQRTAFARGRPNLPGLVEGENVNPNVLSRPNLKFRNAAVFEVKKGTYQKFIKLKNII